MKITFTHHDTKKNSKTSDSLKTDAKQKKSQKPGDQTDQCCRHRSAKTGYGIQMMTSQGEGKKLLRLHARTLTYTLTCSSWPKLPHL